jgi:hypothetical protein
MEFTSSMGTALSDTIKAITGKMEGNSSRGIFSEDSIRSTLADSDFSAVKVSTGKDSSLSAGGTLPPAEKQTHATGSLRAADFIYTSSSKMTLTVTPENLFIMAQGLPEDTKSYLELFMAPVFSGEKMTKEQQEAFDKAEAKYKEDLEKYRADREKKLLKLEEAYQAKHAGKVADADKDTSSGAPQAAQTKKKKWGLFG